MTRPDDGNLNVVNINIKPRKNTFNELSYEVVSLILIESSSD